MAKIDEEGLKLTTVNRNNQALMQYAMTNYGTTNLSAEDWKKCEDNFKLNLLYQVCWLDGIKCDGYYFCSYNKKILDHRIAK